MPKKAGTKKAAAKKKAAPRSAAPAGIGPVGAATDPLVVANRLFANPDREATTYVQPTTAHNGASDSVYANKVTAYVWKPFVPVEPTPQYDMPAPGDLVHASGDESAGIVDRRIAIVGS